MSGTREPQNQIQLDEYQRAQAILGPWNTSIFKRDPKHLAFTFSRYLYVSKLLQSKSRILEVGAGDASASGIVAKECEWLHCVDFEPLLLEDNRKRLNGFFPNLTFAVADLTKQHFNHAFDACFSLDVLEHIEPSQEHLFFENICSSITEHGVAIFGTPNKTASQYASEFSQAGHINLKTYDELLGLLRNYFNNAFMFVLNDAVLHTGFGNMGHYLFGVGVSPRNMP